MEDMQGIPYTEGYEWFPEEELVNYFYNLFSNSELLKNRSINGVDRKTTFYKDQCIDDLQDFDVKYSCPALCVKFGPRVDDNLNQNSSQIDIDALILIDASISAPTKATAEKEALRFKRHIQNLIYEHRYEGNLIIVGMKTFILNPNQNSENKEVTWRIFIEVKYS